MGALVIALPGCRKEKEEEKPSSSSPEVYMNDPVFQKALGDRRTERKDLVLARAKIVEEMKAKVDAMRAKMPGADDAAVKAALGKDSEWTSLEQRVIDLNTALEENRRRTTRIVHDRLAPQKGISK